MRFPFFIALRYLFSKKKIAAVNLLSAISIIGIMVGSAAMIIVLSAFNGLEELVRSFYDTFDPDLKAKPKTEKFLEEKDLNFSALKKLESCISYSMVLEEKALLQFQEKEFIASLKGVDENYFSTTNFSESLLAGEPFDSSSYRKAIFGLGVNYHLGLSSANIGQTIGVFVPKADFSPFLDPTQAFRTDQLIHFGTFSVQPEFDVKYVITSKEFVSSLIDRKGLFSAIEFKLRPGFSSKEAKLELQNILPSSLEILDREQQQETLFKVMKTEGLITYLVLAFILALACFTILGSITMLILDKKKDIKTLWYLGANETVLRRVFLIEGQLLAFIGAISGLLLGVLIVFLQEKYGLISMGQGYASEHYPVTLKFRDLAMVGITVYGLASIVSIISVSRLKVNRL